MPLVYFQTDDAMCRLLQILLPRSYVERATLLRY